MLRPLFRRPASGRRAPSGRLVPLCEPLEARDVPASLGTALFYNALIFGDWNDPASRLNALSQSPRAYRLLQELGTEPVVVYLKKVDPAP